MIEVGTRKRQNNLSIRTPGGSLTRTVTADPGMALRVAGNLTFGSGRVTGNNGDFTAFAGDEVLLVEGTASNNGFFNVTGLDATNQAYLTLDPPPKTEGPVASVVRTA